MFKKIIKKELKKILPELGITDSIKFSVSRPQEKRFGDYSTNLAMILAGKLRKPPFEIAQDINSRLSKMDFIDRVSIEKPAFINFYLHKKALIQKMLDLVQQKTAFLDLDPQKNQKIILEHTNVNPNKALHVGHLRSACLGDSVRKMLTKIGKTVEVEYYVDNTGLQVAITLLGLENLKILEVSQEKDEKFDHFAGRVYAAMVQKIKEESSWEEKKEEKLKILEDYNAPKNAKSRLAIEKIVNANLTTASNYAIEYDNLIWESDIFQFGLWTETLEKLKTLESFYLAKKGKNKGCWVILNEDGREKIIIKSNGVITYTGKDIAYHFWKYGLLENDFKYKQWTTASQKKPLFSTSLEGKAKKDFGRGDFVLNFIDMRQAFPQESVKSALETAGFSQEAKNFRHLGYGVVSLSHATASKLGLKIEERKSSYALSGRDGLVVTADDLLELLKKEILKKHPKTEDVEKVAVGAIKYYLLRPNPFGEIIFDYQEALDIHGNSGPYLQYAYARTQSVLKKIKPGQEKNLKARDLTEFDQKEEEKNLIRFLVHYPETVLVAGKELSPNILANYLFELASLFNSFYNRHSVINCKDPEVAYFRKLLVEAVAITLKDGLTLLGIEAPNKL